MNEILIRNVKKEDLRQVAEIAIRGWQTAYRGIIEDDYLDNLSIEDNYKKRLKDYKEDGLIIAEQKNQVVGFCKYRTGNKYSDRYKDIDCEICALYVKPELKRNGIGKTLFDYVKNEFRKNNHKQMIIWCLKDNYPSRAFYEKMGGKLCGEKTIEKGNEEYKEVGYIYNLEKNSLKKRYADRFVNGMSKNTVYKIKSIKSNEFTGDICYYHFNDVIQKITIPNGKIIIDNEYKWLEFYDYNSKIKLTAIYDEYNKIIEWYFDIARQIGKENGVPYEEDLYLDVVVTSNGEIILLDEDELQEAYNKLIISKQDYNMAYYEAKKLIELLKENKKELQEFTDKYLNPKIWRIIISTFTYLQV